MNQEQKTYPAYSQTILEEPQTSYQNYVQQAKESPYWKQAEFDGFTLPAQGLSKPYCNKVRLTKACIAILSSLAKSQTSKMACKQVPA